MLLNTITHHELATLFYSLISENDEIIVIHSSLLNLKLNQESEWVILSIFKNLIERGHTIAIPSFTFSFTQTQFFELNKKSEVGVLADLVLKLYEFDRTCHPIYSFCVAGCLSKEILSISAASCFSYDSIFAYFSKKRTRIILFGCGYEYVTQFHYYEEEQKVPYRYHKTFVGKKIVNNNSYDIETTMYVRNQDLNISNDFSIAFNELKDRNLLISRDFLDCSVHAFRESDLHEISKNILEKNKLAFVKNQNIVSYQMGLMNKRKLNKKLKIGLISSANLDLLVEQVKKDLGVYFSDYEFEVYYADYGRWEYDIQSANSSLVNFNPNYLFFIDTLEDIFKLSILEDYNENNLILLDKHLSLIYLHKKKLNSKIFVFNFINFQSMINKNFDYIHSQGKNNIIQLCNQKLIDFSKTTEIKIVNLEEVALNAQHNIIDKRLWYLGKFRYSISFTEHFSKKIMGCLLAETGKTVRVLAVDLDNTLWGGVLGEDGIEGIKIGGDYPGNAYKDFQRVLLKLQNRGLVIAILSKNDSDLAIQAIDNHPEMLIKTDHIAAHFINWEEKTNNLEKLSAFLNIGLESILLIDDNPIEREKIRVNLPEVKILDLPIDPANYVDSLISSPYLECLNITKEDKSRSTFYIQQKKMKGKDKNFENIEEYYKFQNMHVYINPLDEYNFSRAMQLINKTNQFNTTTKRYSEDDLKNILQKEQVIFLIGTSDNFMEFENIGLFILIEKNKYSLLIDSFMLSCRVLGKKIESAVMAWIYEYAKKNHYLHINGQIFITQRNTPVRNLYKDHLFTLISHTNNHSEWLFEIEHKKLSVPHWIKLIYKESKINYDDKKQFK